MALCHATRGSDAIAFHHDTSILSASPPHIQLLLNPRYSSGPRTPTASHHPSHASQCPPAPTLPPHKPHTDADAAAVVSASPADQIYHFLADQCNQLLASECLLLAFTLNTSEISSCGLTANGKTNSRKTNLTAILSAAGQGGGLKLRRTWSLHRPVWCIA